jgi:hypothetical protein
MKRPLRPSAAPHPEYPTLKALVLCGSLLVGGAAHADASVPAGQPGGGVKVPQPKGRVAAPLPPGLPPRPIPPQAKAGAKK